jgi:hypothetical protein
LARDCGLRVGFREGDGESGKEAEDDDRRAHFELDGTGKTWKWLSKIEEKVKSATEPSIIIEGLVEHRNMRVWSRCKGKEETV